MHKVGLGLIGTLGLLTTAPAWGCTDGCYSSEECIAVERSYDSYDCGEDPPYLDPASDTRSNIVLLYGALVASPEPLDPASWKTTYQNLDQGPSPEQIAYTDALKGVAPNVEPQQYPVWFDCGGNTYSAATAFLKGLGESSATEVEKRRLAGQRNAMLCANVNRYGQAAAFPDLDLPTDVATTDGAYFATYLRVAANFYWARYEEALREVSSLLSSGNDWIRQTALVVQARAYMVRAQVRWDGYSDRSTIEADDLRRSEESYRAYLDQYPKGPYAASASGQIRRLASLSRDRQAYSAAFLAVWRRTLTDRVPIEQLTPLINEADVALPYRDLAIVDGRLQGGVRDDALLFTAGVLVFFRDPTAAAQDTDRLVRAEIEHRSKDLKPIAGLQDSLLAVDAFAHQEWDRVIELTSPLNADSSPIAQTKAVLRARAFGKRQSVDDALQAWAHVIEKSKGAALNRAQAAYAQIALLAGRPKTLVSAEGVVPPDAPVVSYAIRHLFNPAQLRDTLDDVAVPPLLRSRARMTLQTRLALAKDWAGFMTLYESASAEDQAPFGPMATAAKTLASEPNDPRALLNVGYFFIQRVDLSKDLDLCRLPDSLDESLRATLPPEYSNPDSPQYDRPIAYFIRALEQKPGGDLEAKILYHAINCYSGRWRDECADPELPIEIRKAWFVRLKREYPSSEWAKKAKYWW